ncbi:CRISPR-associated protein Cas4 [Pseudoflavonifractor sp. 60]|uniref:CRISPR-associated protein Cas4 n=1 Tax=Pseudoflavonifractor sp. 60 TaxID=2304576 RepID=UPI001370E776|nr:CRISPR-associated protein Cas4 [Pseudoflavonifractor sp. 60]MCI8914889.1 CRISPR-associated protein Cas4 [Lawsonibacter sp.]NBI67382.1 CRISPR-associated protein Cas4 [Pseudoflavonifractor sp. 60]
MSWPEEDWLQLSGLQHFAFCRRQWALIHIENQWAENYRTVDGHLMHEHVHDQGFRESRGDCLIVRGLAIHSAELGISGQCDVVEFHKDSAGIPLQNREGLWQPYPVEYKRGKPKANNADELQLCAQAMCLEEMLCCTASKGALYYGEPHRRTVVQFTPELRSQVQDNLTEMHELYKRRYTPKVKPSKACNACSLKELCLPRLMNRKKVADYLAAAMEELK